MRRFIFGWSSLFFPRGALLDAERNPKSGPAGTIEREESGKERSKRLSEIDNFARDAAAIVPNFINSEYAHRRAQPSLLEEKINEAKEDRGEREGARE